MKNSHITLTVIVTTLITACSSYGTYTVKPGDSLSVIAIRHNISLTELAKINNIDNPNLIRAGQELKVKGGSSAKVRGQSNNSTTVSRGSASKASDHSIQASSTYKNTPIPKMGGWQRPTNGTVVRSFNPNLPGHRGVQIAGTLNQPIVSANNGQVVYAGQGSSGLGQLVIIKHANNVYTAYGYLAGISVRENHNVKAGDRIGSMGISSDGRTILHFEIRVNGNPINPTRYVKF